MSYCRRVAALLPVFAILFSGLWSSELRAQSCPQVLGAATRLVVVTTAGWSSVPANIQRYERATPAEAWRPNGVALPGVVGLTGMGWAWSFEAAAKPGEPIKREGDKRTPAGIFTSTSCRRCSHPPPWHVAHGLPPTWPAP